MSLPFLPGNCFTDPSQSRFPKGQTLEYKNGYKIPEVHLSNPLSDDDLDELARCKPSLTYGQAIQAPPEDFVPAKVYFDKKVLSFNAYFKQTVHESDAEFYCIRPVKICYYLEDDSISVVEPVVVNSGIPQGVLIKRQRLPKDNVGNYYHWKDFNVGIDVTFYGKTFKLYDCDGWTQEYMASEGIVLNPAEECPVDPYTKSRQEQEEQKTHYTTSDFDKLKQFKELDGKVLKFYCIWDDRDSMFGNIRPFVLHYYLADNTLEVREVRMQNDGHELFPVFIGRNRIPIDHSNVPASFPSVTLELTEKEIDNWFEPRHLNVGKTVFIRNRHFFLYDCDKFTSEYYKKNFNIKFEPVGVFDETPSTIKQEIPPYNGFGSLEDTLQSCLSLTPHPPKKDYIQMLENNNNILRYQLRLETVRPEDKFRKFIMSYRLADDMITIYEKAQRNSGIAGGKFLSRNRVTKPGSTVDSPQFYTPADFSIGAVIEIFKHRFTIIDADEYVLKYLQSSPGEFPLDTINSIRIKHGKSCLDEPTAYMEDE